MLIPGEAAIGAIIITNLTTQAVRVPEGLIVSTLDAIPIRFFTTKAGVVSPGPGRTLTLPVQALAPGETGNLASGSVAAIEGELGLSLLVTNPYATHGGSDVAAPAPREQDRQILLRQLTTTLRASALSDLQNSLEEGDLLLSTSLELADTLEETYAPASGLPGDQLELTLRIEYQALVVAAENLQALAVPVLDGSLAEGTLAVPGTLILRHTGFSEPDEQGAVTWTLNAQRSVHADISADEAIQMTVGQPTGTAAKLLASSLPLAGDPRIELSPSWWPRLPYLPFRIEVITE
jgi:hypothetical protein